MEKEYKLTISILASNRIDTLPKTLESIKPILDNVSSELIVTDTGCCEELLEIIRRYTTKIEKFTWCKDFAKARNVGLYKAKGEWFMFIDDDEWFENVDEIIEFFNSDEEKKYNSLYYKVRNYYNIEGSEWNDAVVTRGTRLIENVHFEDIIHEHFSVLLKPVKMFDVYAHHYGYAFKNEEEHKLHIKRNLSMLEKQMEEGNSSLRQYVHILQEYCGLGQFDKAYSVALDGIKTAENIGEDNKRFMGAVKVNAVYCLLKLGKCEEAVKLANEYLRRGGITMAAYCALNCHLAEAYSYLNDDFNLSMASDEYFALREELNKYKEETNYEAMATVAIAFSNSTMNRIFNMSLFNGVSNKDEARVLKVLNYQELVEELKCENDPACLVNLVDMMRESEHKERYGAVLVRYMTDMMSATKICTRLLDIREQSEEDFMSITEHIVSNECNNPYIKLLKTIYYGLKSEVDK